MNPIPKEIFFPQRSPEEYGGKIDVEYGAYRLVKEQPEIKISSGERTVWLPGFEENITVSTLIEVATETANLSQIGCQPFDKLSEKEFIYRQFGVEVKKDHQSGIITVSIGGERLGIYPLLTSFSDEAFNYPQLNILLGGIMILPDGSVLPSIREKGLLVGSCQTIGETAMALPKGVLLENLPGGGPEWVKKMEDDVLLMVALKPIFWEALQESRQTLFYENELLKKISPVAIRTNPTGFNTFQMIGKGKIGIRGKMSLEDALNWLNE